MMPAMPTFFLAEVPPESLRLVTGEPVSAVFPWGWLLAGVVVAAVVGVASLRLWLGFVDRNAGALAFASLCRSAGVSRRERAALRELAGAYGCSPSALWLSDALRAEAEKALAAPNRRNAVPSRPNERNHVARRSAKAVR